jgi:hypothetical protein
VSLRGGLAAALALAALPAPALAQAAAPGSFARAAYSTPLAKACPNALVVQLDWLPQAEHGGLFQLIGGGGRMSHGRYEGALGSTGIKLILLAGGNGIGLGDGETSLSSLYMGNSRARLRPHLALVDLDGVFVFSRRFPAVGVVAQLDKSPIGLFWDRATYPRGFKSVADLRAFAASGRGKMYISTTRRTFGRYLLSQNIPRSAFVEGYAGDGENFVLNRGRWLNQGSITSEGYQFAHGRKWARPVDFLLLSEMGYPLYPGMVSVATNRLAELSPCLRKVVPLMQQSMVDYARNPAEANATIHRFNKAGLGARWWQTSPELLANAVVVLQKRGVIGNGPNRTLGDFDMARSERLLARLRPFLDIRARPKVQPRHVVTNRFIDPAIGLK